MIRSHGQRPVSVKGRPERILAMLAAGWKESPSANSQFSRLARRAPTVVLPLPDTPPINTIMLREHSLRPSGPAAQPPGPLGAAAPVGAAPAQPVPEVPSLWRAVTAARQTGCGRDLAQELSPPAHRSLIASQDCNDMSDL